MKIYVIQGSTGEYSDHMEWPVCAFKDEQKAKDFIVQLTQEANAFMAQFSDSYEWYDWFYEFESRRFGPPPNDPKFRCDSSRFNYAYFETELRDD